MADPTLTRLEDQLGYYERTASRSQKSFRVVKVVQLIVAAAVPVTATAGASAVVTASIGGLILVLEGVQALFGWQQNWVNYRNTAEALKVRAASLPGACGPLCPRQQPRAAARGAGRGAALVGAVGLGVGAAATRRRAAGAHRQRQTA